MRAGSVPHVVQRWTRHRMGWIGFAAVFTMLAIFMLESRVLAAAFLVPAIVCAGKWASLYYREVLRDD